VKIIHGYQGLNADQKGSTVALGNFDGVHRGHVAVIEAARSIAPDAPLAVVSFDPHPRAFFQPAADPFILTPLNEKIEKVKALGVDRLYVLRFDSDLAAMTPEAFVQEVLIDGLGIVGVVRFSKGTSAAGPSDLQRRTCPLMAS